MDGRVRQRLRSSHCRGTEKPPSAPSIRGSRESKHRSSGLAASAVLSEPSCQSKEIYLVKYSGMMGCCGGTMDRMEPELGPHRQFHRDVLKSPEEWKRS